MRLKNKSDRDGNLHPYYEMRNEDRDKRRKRRSAKAIKDYEQLRKQLAERRKEWIEKEKHILYLKDTYED